jgi:glutathione synthase/RimK-type ligase-like ATP-grasp enzyme
MRKLGLQVPETLITTDPDAARAFARQYGEVVYKSTSGERSIVRRLTKERYDELVDIANCPTQFQRYIPGHDIRVHVIGDQVEAVQVQSECDDYRYAARNGGHTRSARTELDPRIAASLRAAVCEMDLLVAGIDLRRTPAGDVYCLEINPSPAFTYYEQLAGVTLANKLAALLLS